MQEEDHAQKRSLDHDQKQGLHRVHDQKQVTERDRDQKLSLNHDRKQGLERVHDQQEVIERDRDQTRGPDQELDPGLQLHNPRDKVWQKRGHQKDSMNIHLVLRTPSLGVTVDFPYQKQVSTHNASGGR